MVGTTNLPRKRLLFAAAVSITGWLEPNWKDVLNSCSSNQPGLTTNPIGFLSIRLPDWFRLIG